METSRTPSRKFARRVERLLGRGEPVDWRPASGGYTAAERWVARFRDGGSAFLKAGTTPNTARWLRNERRIYSGINAPYLARVLGWDDDGVCPLLALEDLSGAHWPPPWESHHVEGVVSALEDVRATPPPAGLSAVPEDDFRGWERIAEEPARFARAGLAPREWLENALPFLVEASKSARLDGHELVHEDVRSDNLCFSGERVLLLDWDGAYVGNADLSLALWLPSLHAEGGPPPHEIMPDASEWAALVSGYYAALAWQRGNLPPGEEGHAAHGLMRRLAQYALPWAVRELRLPPLS
ncbi:MAG: aminoglycoside phosphotransferase family protein [Chloroflexota bacterium]